MENEFYAMLLLIASSKIARLLASSKIRIHYNCFSVSKKFRGHFREIWGLKVIAAGTNPWDKTHHIKSQSAEIESSHCLFLQVFGIFYLTGCGVLRIIDLADRCKSIISTAIPFPERFVSF